jgi:hypothetical protein
MLYEAIFKYLKFTLIIACLQIKAMKKIKVALAFLMQIERVYLVPM